MAEPSQTTLDLYDGLAGYQRRDDQKIPGTPLLQYLSLPGEQLDDVRVLAERLNAYSTTARPASPSALTDPDLADPGWLDWLARSVGAHLAGLSEVMARRDAIRSATTGFRKGTRGAIAGAAATALTGTRYVRVYSHSVASPGDGTIWDILIVTREEETPSIGDVLAAVVAHRAKPAGAVLHYRAYSATYAETAAANTGGTYASRQAMFPTYRDAHDYVS